MLAPILSDSDADYTPGVSRRDGSATTFVHAGLKNTSSQSNESEAVASSRVYDAFGNVVASSGTWNGPYGYAGNFGYHSDANGLHLLGARYYDSSIGRFVTSDPIRDGRNWYSYCGSNPVSRTDPSGMIAFAIVAYWASQVADFIGLAYDGYTFYNEPSLGNGGMLLWSIVGAVTPAPGAWVGHGLHKLWRWLTKADEAVEAAEAVAKGTSRGASGDELAARRARGLEAEAKRIEQLKAEGEIVGPHPRFKTPFGDRVGDIGVYEDPEKTLIKRVEEVKTGDSWYGGKQKTKDDWIKAVLGHDVVVVRDP